MSYSGRQPWDANDPYPGDECDHVDYEADILTGIATCHCGHRWMQTSQEIASQREAQAVYDKQCDEWDRADRSLAQQMKRLLGSLRVKWRRGPEDEIPF